MVSDTNIPNGLYRLIKWEEDENPVFPSPDTVVEVRDGYVINCSTRRRWPLASIGSERSFYGPIRTPYDGTSLRKLKRIDMGAPQEAFAVVSTVAGAA